MKESIHKYFKVGTLLWMSYPRTGTVEGAVKIARDDYFDAIEVTQCKSVGTGSSHHTLAGQPRPPASVFWI